MNASERQKERKRVSVHTGKDQRLIPRPVRSVGLGHFVGDWCVVLSHCGLNLHFLNG